MQTLPLNADYGIFAKKTGSWSFCNLQVSLPLLPKHPEIVFKQPESLPSHPWSKNWDIVVLSDWPMLTMVQDGWCGQGVGLPIRIESVSISWMFACGMYSML